MPRKKKETLVHLDLETLSKETGTKKTKNDETLDSSLGGVLRKSREKKKLTIVQVAKKLCIRDVYLEALEEGNYYVFPGLAYGIGFLRTYARFLGLDANEMVEKFHAETSSIQIEPMEMPIPQNANLMPSGRTIFKALIALIIVYLVWYIGISLTQVTPAVETSSQLVVNEVVSQSVSDETITDDAFVSEALNTNLKVAPMETNAVLDEKIDEKISENTVDKNQVIQKNTADGVVAKAVFRQAPIIADTVTKETEPIQMKKAGFGGKLWSKLTPAKVYGEKKAGALSFVATEEVWLKISDGATVVLEEILYEGDRYNVPSDVDYTLTTANAGALTVYVNGKKKKALGAKGVLIENMGLNPSNFN